MIKKKIVSATVVVALLLIFFVLFLAHRSNRSYQYVIHKDAKSIIKINVDGIYKSIAINFIQNPSYYLNTNDKKSKTKELRDGFSFPSNIFLFTINGMASDTFFGSLPLSNINDFRSFAKHKLGIVNLENKDGLLMGRNQNQKITVAIFKNRIAFSFSNRNEDTFTILKDLLKRKNIIADDDIRITRLKNNTNHLGYLNNKTELFANFNAGGISLGGSLPIAIKNAQNIQLDSQSAIQFYLNAPIANFGKSNIYQIDNYTLNLDSIFKYHQGLTTFELIKTTKQIDTAITYDYNDDFEKVEQVSLRTVIVPEMILNMNSNGLGLANYLKSIAILDQGNVLNRKVFPLYAAYARYNNQSFSLSTTKEVKKQPHQRTEGSFYLKIDFDQLRKNEALKLINQYFVSLQKLEIKTDHKAKLTGLIQFTDPNINALLQLR